MLKNLNPQKHIAPGKAIAALREKSILIISSGMSFHNLKTFFSNDIDSGKENEGFDHWLIETCTNPVILTEEREQRLIEWEKTPLARFYHRREEHLLPLHICYGIACSATPIAKVVLMRMLWGKSDGLPVALGSWNFTADMLLPANQP